MRLGRVARIVAGIAGTVIALAGIGVGLVGWRLAQGPLPLNFLTPRIERALSDEDAEVKVADTVLAWAGWRRNFDIRIRGVRMVARDGQPLLDVPEVAVELSARALLQHRLVAPVSLEVIGAQLVLVHAADGVWRFRGPGGGQNAPSASALILEEVLAPGDPQNPLSYLDSVALVDSRVTLIDEASGRTYAARDAQINVERDDNGLRAELAAVVDVAGKPASFAATGQYAAANGTLGLAAKFADLDPSFVTAAAPELRALGGVAVPLSGRFDLAFDPQFRVAQAGFELTGDSGRLAAASYGLPEDAPVRHLRLAGRLTRGMSGVEISDAEVDLGGPVISLRGSMTDADAHPRATGTVTIRNLTADDLRRLWPTDLAPHARAWLSDNELGGSLSEAHAEIQASAQAPTGPWTVEQVQGAFKLAGAEVNYLTPLPHVRDVAADGTFSRSRVDITVAGGQVGDLRLGTASVALTGLDTDDAASELDVPITGPLRQALQLIDSPPLGELKKAGLKPGDFSGDMALRLTAKLPLAADLSADQVDVHVTGRIQRLAMRQAAFGQDISDGDVELAVDKAGLDIKGRATLGPIPADIDVHRDFSTKAAVPGRAKIKARIASAAELAALGVDVSPYVDGPASLTVDYVERRGGRSEATIDATLDEAALSAAPLGWHKPQGQQAAAHAALRLGGGQPMQVPEFSFTSGDPAAGGLVVRGRAALAADGKSLAQLDLATLKVGLTDVHGAVRNSASGMSVALAGPSLNIGPLLHADTGQSGSGSASSATPLGLDIRVEHLYSDADRHLDRFHFIARRGRERWESVDLAAQTTDQDKRPGHASAKLHTLPDGRQTLDVAIDDAGAFLDDLGITSNLFGGRLTAHGATDVARQGKPLAGHLHMTAYRIVNAPLLARLMSVALLTGIVDSLSGPGIRFAKLDSDFAYYGPSVDLEDAHTAGAAVGISAAGTIDIDGDALDLKGTIVPAYALNSLPGRIPLIGQLLTAGSRGIFATNYAVSGPMSSPAISINAASTLAPSFLRHLFGAAGDTSARQ